MTCREKLKMEHPDEIGDNYTGGCFGCPNDYGYLEKDMTLCADDNINSEGKCKKCWDIEIPDTEPTVREEKPELRPIDPHHIFNEMAEVHRAAYDSYRNFGFTDEQAFALVCILFEKDIETREITLL